MINNLSRNILRRHWGNNIRCQCSSATATTSGMEDMMVYPSDMTEKTRQLANALSRLHTNRPLDRTSLLQRRFALARAITLVESTAPAQRHQGDLLLTYLLQNATKEKTINPEATVSSFRVGIAGPPGAGKSTFIETFGLRILNNETSEPQEKGDDSTSYLPSKIAVICIDPSSSVTGGSILGDKTRMIELSRHDRAYVRPSANGGTFGGLSAYTHDVVSLCEAAGYDLVLVESVGLGQSEVEIAQSVDMLVLIIPPAGGDELQGVKKGIVEVADMLIVNKADGNLLPAARSTATDYKAAMKFLRQRTEGWKTPVILSSSHTGDGIDKVWREIQRYRIIAITSGQLQRKRRKQNEYWMWKNLQRLISVRTQNDPRLRTAAETMEEALRTGAVTPRVAASELLNSLINNGRS